MSSNVRSALMSQFLELFGKLIHMKTVPRDVRFFKICTKFDSFPPWSAAWGSS